MAAHRRVKITLKPAMTDDQFARIAVAMSQIQQSGERPLNRVSDSAAIVDNIHAQGDTNEETGSAAETLVEGHVRAALVVLSEDVGTSIEAVEALSPDE